MKKTFAFIVFLLLSVFLFSQTNHKPTAVDDYAVTFRGKAIVNLIANDYDIDGDSIYVFPLYPQHPLHGTIKGISSGVIEYDAFPTYTGGIDSFTYLIHEFGAYPTNLWDTGKVFLTVDKPLSYDSVNINNIKAAVNANGFLFCKLIPYNGHWDYYPKFEVPKGSKLNTFYSGTLWLGGIDSDDSLHLAAENYEYYGNDYWAGPVSDVYDSAYDYKFKRLWKITKADIDYHVAHCWDANYIPSQSIIDWPGNGDVSKGQSAIIAPFYDRNGDGIYDPYVGDYPLIKGDEAVLFIFNDDRFPHTESKGKKLGVEVRAMLYAFDCPVDSALWNTVFLSYEIINRSANTYHDTYIGNYLDNDNGYGYDDFVACDVQRGSYYSYNGTDIDGSLGYPPGYGYFPPAQSVTVLGGPFIDPDGIDNPAGNCDEGINGLNFGNNIIDDERYGLSFSGWFLCAGGLEALTCPYETSDFYNYLRGCWRDSVQLHYWGIGHPQAGGYGPVCRYMYPGTSDPCNYGTWGVDPGGTEPWTEEQAGNSPYDRRSHGSSGPFTFYPGQVEYLDLAFVNGRNFADSSAKAAIPVMQTRIDSVRSYFIKDKTPCGGRFSGYKPAVENPGFLYVYPNPTNGSIWLEYAPGSFTHFIMFDIIGNVIMSGAITETRKHQIDVSALRSGMYFLSVDDGVNTTIRKILKVD